MVHLPAAEIRRAVRQGLEEDLAHGDVTTSAIFLSRVPAQAKMPTWEPLVREVNAVLTAPAAADHNENKKTTGES